MLISGSDENLVRALTLNASQLFGSSRSCPHEYVFKVQQDLIHAMKYRLLAVCGILAPLLYVFTVVLGGILTLITVTYQMLLAS